MKPIAQLLLIFFIFYPPLSQAEPDDPDLIDDPDDTVEVIPWDIAPGEEVYEEEDDDEDKYERPTQEYNVNININENQQPYYWGWGPYYPVGIGRRDIVADDPRPPRKPSKSPSWGRPWMPAGKPTRR